MIFFFFDGNVVLYSQYALNGTTHFSIDNNKKTLKAGVMNVKKSALPSQE